MATKKEPVPTPPAEQDITLVRMADKVGVELSGLGNNPIDVEAALYKKMPDIDRSAPDVAPELDLWKEVNRPDDEFARYSDFIDSIMDCSSVEKSGYHNRNADMNRLPFTSTQAYSLLKYATEYYVKATKNPCDPANPGSSGYSGANPYFEEIIRKLGPVIKPVVIDCDDRVRKPCPVLIELIWSYWHEEGLLVQTMNAISRRFQNMRSGIGDGLAKLDIDPLRPLGNILWGYIQDTQHRLTIQRRAYEYDHHYGVNLIGKAITHFNPADSRSGFMAAFNNLLNRCAHFYREFDDNMRNADGFPVLNALQEVHLLLAEGAHNQFGDLPTTARVEMLIEQWILARPEVREFLGGRAMMPYKAGWMDRIDTMKTIQNWDRTSVKYYNDLAVYGEKLLLSIRYTNWSNIANSGLAAIWAVQFRNAIQTYIHRYQVVTGVDLSADAPDFARKDYGVMPGALIQKRIRRDSSLGQAI